MSVVLKTTLGDLKVELYCEEVAKTCGNFLALAASGYYDGTLFHRNIKGFMVQGGDPTGTGRGGKSIYPTANGKFEDEIVDRLKHAERGVLSMANSGPNTNGSQFFLTYAKMPHLNGKYTIFGRLIGGGSPASTMRAQLVPPQCVPSRQLILVLCCMSKLISVRRLLAQEVGDLPVDPPCKPSVCSMLWRIRAHFLGEPVDPPLRHLP